VTARDPDPDRFVVCRRLVLGVDMTIPSLSENEWVARAVGFEPTIPDLETGALGQAKLRPYRCRHVAILRSWSLGAELNGCFLSHNQAFWPLNYRRVGAGGLI
jgi:hypothetical protein